MIKKLALIAGLSIIASCGPGRNNQAMSNGPLSEADLVVESNNIQVIQNKLEISSVRKVVIDENSDITDLIKYQSQYTLNFNSLNNTNYSQVKVNCFDITKASEAPKLIASSSFVDGLEAKVDLDFSTSKVIENKIRCDLNFNNETIKSITKKYYKDVVVSEEKSFEEFNPGLNAGENKVGALIISSSGTLFIKNAKIKIKTSDLFIADNGLITTFKKNDLTTTPDNQDGESGGDLTIVADNAYGRLNVVMIGKNGGRQTRVPEKREDLPILYTNLNVSRFFDCSKIQNGKDGANGEQGFPGMNGGNSGNFELIVKGKKDYFDAINSTIMLYPGKGSLGGVGGKPSKGTKGQVVNYSYDIGADTCDTHCRPRIVANSCHGVDGKDGAIGIDGLKGLDGKVGRKSITVPGDENV